MTRHDVEADVGRHGLVPPHLTQASESRYTEASDIGIVPPVGGDEMGDDRCGRWEMSDERWEMGADDGAMVAWPPQKGTTRWWCSQDKKESNRTQAPKRRAATEKSGDAANQATREHTPNPREREHAADYISIGDDLDAAAAQENDREDSTPPAAQEKWSSVARKPEGGLVSIA
ncbi:hypothetical protein CC1G_08924 [Coprinopsis cinerea okayama7|uniref:Uncharacterized protein n=1 Tax=Coprinopsis cinerea (strain Okayama-7 / 130 / ATCC MYA-4618 / FGSC 9003) TaxID=240176 RepID=A8P8C7_COPC7|nr:hypothetical protein CC1G_08924 [Coprinopsis cinerea okayama7\|eukprot:XP_001839545.1 hypothetical protein CC1G_08924 [Coprinopsis cinerea okayama7\